MLIIQTYQTRGWKTIAEAKNTDLTFDSAFDEIVSILSDCSKGSYRIAVEKEINYGYEQFPKFNAIIKPVDSNTVDIEMTDYKTTMVRRTKINKEVK